MLPRKPQKAVHSTDPGQSGWWLLAPAGGIVAGVAIPYFATHSAAWTTGGGVIGAAVGAAAGATPQFRDWVSARSRRRRIAESAGAATNISKEPLESLRVHNSDRDITEFVPRDIQNQLVEHLNNGTPVLIEGPSMSGKTRLALETIRSHWPEAPFWFPRDDGDIERLLSSSQQPAPHIVILLDDLDRFLSNQTLTLGLLNHWINNSCTIVATMMHSQYVKHSDRTNEKVSGWDTVNRFKRITLNPSLSTEELNAVKLTSYANQLSQIESIGLGPLLGCAEAVRTAFTDELDKHSWCGALIKAAADWRRVGLGFATKSQLITLSAAHGNNVWDETEWDDTWRHATTPIKNTTPLLRQVGIDEWEVIDIVADEATWSLSNEFLISASSLNLSDPQKFILALEMCRNAATRARAEKMLETLVSNDPKNTWAAIAYANLLKNIHNNIDHAEILYKSAVHNEPKHAFALRIYADFLASFRNDSVQAEKLFQQAIEADPEDSSNLGAYAEFLADFRNDPEKTEELFRQAIDADPKDSYNLRNYARFSIKFQSNLEKAEKLFQQAIEADPEDSSNLGAYAEFLADFRNDPEKTEELFRQAIDADPKDSYNLRNYARFSIKFQSNLEKAEKLFQQAIEADPEDVYSLISYAFFLTDLKDDINFAEQQFKNAIDASPHNASALICYAHFVEKFRNNHDLAEQLYKRAINLNPNDSYPLHEYAEYLARRGGSKSAIEELFRKSLAANNKSSFTYSAYANYLISTLGDSNNAEFIFLHSLESNPNDQYALSDYALFLHTHRRDLITSSLLYEHILNTHPRTAHVHGNYSQVLFIRQQDTAAIDLAEKAIELSDINEYALLAECHFYLFAHSPEHRKESGGALKTLLADGVTTGDWSFEMNLERVRREEDPRLELLEAVAQALRDGDMSRLNAFEEWRDL